jgi:heme exporter protein B
VRVSGAGGFLRLVGRDLRLSLRQGGDAATAVLFFVLVVVLFPFGVGPEPNTLARIAPGVIWVAALLAALLSIDRLFQSDFDDGSLDHLALSPLPLEFVVLAKALAHWLVTGLPLVAAAPVLAVLYRMPAEGFPVLVMSLLLGTPLLSLLGAIGAALTLGARRSGVLAALLLLPLEVPVLIFGVGAVNATVVGLEARPHLLLLAGLLAAALPLAPVAAAAALRGALE